MKTKKWDCGKIKGTVHAVLSDETLTISGAGEIMDYEGRNFVLERAIEENDPEVSAPWWYDGITNVVIEEGVTSIGGNAFSGCRYLNSVIIPNSVISIGYCAFFYCLELASVTIPDSVTYIGDSAFAHCSELTSVTIPKGVTAIKSDTFSYCSNLTSVNIPDGVTSIEEYAFNVCCNLISVTIPNGVISIGECAFSDCDGLTSVISLNPAPSDIESDTFDDLPKNATLYVPKGSIEVYRNKEGWKKFKNIQEDVPQQRRKDG